MKINSFFRLLNYKIKQYEKVTSKYFFEDKHPVTIIWIENGDEEMDFKE